MSFKLYFWLKIKKISMLVLGFHSKDRKSMKDKSSISNPKENRGCPPLTASRTSVDCVQVSLGPSIQYIPLRVYRTGGFNAMYVKYPCGHVRLNRPIWRRFSYVYNQHKTHFRTWQCIWGTIHANRPWNALQIITLYLFFYLWLYPAFEFILIYKYLISIRLSFTFTKSFSSTTYPWTEIFHRCRRHFSDVSG